MRKQTALWEIRMITVGENFDSTVTVAIIACFATIGACCGSFAQAAASRLLQNEAIIAPPSRCRQCDRRLGAAELVPIISWLYQQGRCACQKWRLSVRYIIVETGLALLFAGYAVALPLQMAIGFASASVFITIVGLTDLEALRLHPVILMILAVIGLMFAAAGHFQLMIWHIGLDAALGGALCGAAAPWLINTVYRAVRHKNGLGTGDIWLLGAIGIWLGPLAGWVLLMLASASGALCGIALIATNKAHLSSKLPFGSFIAVIFLVFPFVHPGGFA
jgi:leader peptidase (prepilin peptidase)/N-methyltransferase